MTLNISANNRPMDDPNVQLEWNWRKLPMHWRWIDRTSMFWDSVRHRAAVEQAQSDRKRAARIAEKAVANAAR